MERERGFRVRELQVKGVMAADSIRIDIHEDHILIRGPSKQPPSAGLHRVCDLRDHADVTG